MTERIQNVHPKEYNGIKYRSTLEADTAKVLSLLNIPFSYEDRKITLLEGFKCPYEDTKVRAITYTPDFEIPLLGNKKLMLECKGFATPEWKNKRKYLFKYLMENEPDTMFKEINNCRKDLLKALDNYWYDLGYYIEATDKKGNISIFSSVSEAITTLSLERKPIGPILSCLVGNIDSTYKHSWQLKKIEDITV